MKYIVFLRSCGNIDMGECPYEEVSPPYFAHAESIERCAQRVRNYIEDMGLEVDNGVAGRFTKKKLGI